MKKHSKKLFSLCLATMVLSGSINPAFASPADNEGREMTMTQQQKKGRIVTGTITDATDGSSIIGANIMVKGSTVGIISDIDGNFSIQVDGNKEVLVISYIGYKTQEVQVRNMSSLNIKLTSDTELLDEVIVVGYGSQKKATVTGSVSQIDGEEMKKANKVNLTSSLAGKTAGVIANTRSGEPGEDGASILIRGKGTMGNNSPLIVVDGVADRGFGRLNSEDIESISVLKDASAAIYGARAANGVILVTTKRGKEGKIKVNYAGDYSISQPTRVPEMANSLQYATYINEFDDRKGNAPSFSQEVIDHIKKGDDPIRYADTDWWDAATNKWAPQTQHSLSVSGGNDKLSFYTSAQFLYQDAIYKDSPQNFYQYQFKSNIDAQISKSIKFSFDILGRQEVRNRTAYDTNSIFATFLAASPMAAPFYPNGMLQAGDNAPDDNPIVKTQGHNGTKKYVYNLITIKPYLKIDLAKVLPGLYLDGYAALDYVFTHTKTFKHPYDIYMYNPQNGNYENQKAATGVISLNQNSNHSDRITLNGRIGYQKSFGEHNFDAFLAYEQSVYNYSSMDAYRQNFLSTAIPELFAGSSNPEDSSNGGSSTKTARQNYFGRITYNYQQRYLAEIAARYDGSVNFAGGKRWGFFPSASLGWVVSEENFFKNLTPIINFLKLKGSFGIMGNDNINAYQYLTQYKFTDGMIFGNDLDVNKTLNMTRTANPNVTWETAKTFNLGFSSQFLNGKFGLDFDYFHSKRTDILIQRSASVPWYTGLNLPAENLGRVNNSGVEMIANYHDQKGDFKWNVTANFTYARNKVDYMDEAASVPEWQKREGMPIDGFVLYDAIGIYQTPEEVESTPHLKGAKPGDLIYRDINGDGAITTADQFRTDETETPQILYGFTLGGEWKGFDLSVFFQGQAKAKYILKPKKTNFAAEFYEGRWSESNTPEENLKARWPRAMIKNAYDDGFNGSYSTWWLRSAAFLRLKNVELGYTLPKRWMNPVGLESCRLYVSGSNLFTIDDIKICDPESPNDTGGTQFYPLSRTFSFGVNLSF